MGPTKLLLENEPSWLNMEAFKAARVLMREGSAFQHNGSHEVEEWDHAFVYHPSEIAIPRAGSARSPKTATYGRWVHIVALVEHLTSVKYDDFSSLPSHGGTPQI